MNPLIQAVEIGVRANHEMDRFFAWVGSTDHPRGRIVSIYRNTRRALGQTVERGRWDIAAARDVLNNFRFSVMESVQAGMLRARRIGEESARAQLTAYEQRVVHDPETLMGSAVEAIGSVVAGQIATALGLIVSGADPALVLGDEDHLGIFAYSTTARELTTWGARESGQTWAGMVGRSVGPEDWQKQAIAALDLKTTRTCIRVHGQIQPLNGKFHLTEEPRFADYLEWNPFHYRCRTAVVLYLPAFDAGLTERMREESRRAWGELQARQK